MVFFKAYAYPPLFKEVILGMDRSVKFNGTKNHFPFSSETAVGLFVTLKLFEVRSGRGILTFACWE